MTSPTPTRTPSVLATSDSPSTHDRRQQSGGEFAGILSASAAGMRRNFLPGVVLWAVGLALVGAYYGMPIARPVYERIAAWKSQGGFAFSSVSSALFGGLIPFLVLWALDRIPEGRRFGTAAFLIGFWAVRGVEIDALYRLQGYIFGTGTDVVTVVKKVAVDQFVYSLLWSAPFSLLAYRWKDAGFSWSVFASLRERRFWLHDIPIVVVSLWGVWVPAVAIIYALPADLQIPLFSVVLCFWVLLLETLAAKPLAGSNPR
jgi:hypothetical protein